MTHLRYFVPFAVSVNRTLNGCVQQWFIHDRSNTKYNGMSHDVNWKRYENVVAEMSFITPIDRHDVCQSTISDGCDVLFTVESSPFKIARGRHISISHGLDFMTHARRLSACDAYVCPTVITSHHLLDDVVKVVPPTPPSLFDVDSLKSWGHTRYVTDDRVVATVLYPDRGHTSIADAVIKHLDRSGCNVYVKQRRKWQQIMTHDGTHVYDDSWSPAEAIALPLISDVVVGFGSTAYIDLVHAGVQYIDCPVFDHGDWLDMSQWPTFRRAGRDDITRVVDDMLGGCHVERTTCAVGDVDSFVRKLVMT